MRGAVGSLGTLCGWRMIGGKDRWPGAAVRWVEGHPVLAARRWTGASRAGALPTGSLHATCSRIQLSVDAMNRQRCLVMNPRAREEQRGPLPTDGPREADPHLPTHAGAFHRRGQITRGEARREPERQLPTSTMLL